MEIKTKYDIGQLVWYIKHDVQRDVTCPRCGGTYIRYIAGNAYKCENCQDGRTAIRVVYAALGIIKSISVNIDTGKPAKTSYYTSTSFTSSDEKELFISKEACKEGIKQYLAMEKVRKPEWDIIELVGDSSNGEAQAGGKKK